MTKNKIPRPSFQELKWYTDFSGDNGSKWTKRLSNRKENQMKKLFDNPNYICLRPEYLTTVDSKDFVSLKQ
jgi:hypothetical protein